MEYQKYYKLLHTTSENKPKFNTKKSIMISLVMQKIDTNQVNKQDLKHQYYNQIHAITVMDIYC